MTDTVTEHVKKRIWVRLRRRKVVQWGIAYLAGAWGVLQGTGFLADAFHWPDGAKQIATLVLLIGLPIALVLAWYHGDRGAQRVSGSEMAILATIFFAGGGVLWWHQRAAEPSVAASRNTVVSARVGISDVRPSIAVLPFENRSRLEDDAFFVDGVHDDILTQLTRIGAMKVIARTSVEQFRDTTRTASEIGQRLGVGTILEGGVQRAGDRVRVTVQLIDTKTEVHLWAESYDRELTASNIFAIQSEVAVAVAGALEAALTPAEQSRANKVPTQNLQAWEAYQLGQQRMTKRASAALTEAEKFFREAIDLDPRFALAYVGLANTLGLQLQYSGVPEEPALSDAEKAVAEAHELDPTLAEAWASSGLLATRRGQFERALSMFRRAIELNPNYATARLWYGHTLPRVGKWDESVAQIQRAMELDPLSPMINESLGNRLAAQGRFQEAHASYRRAIRIEPSRPGSYLALAGLEAYAFDRFAEAVLLARRAIELDADSPVPYCDLALLYFDLGDDSKFFETTDMAAKRWLDYPAIHYRLALGNLWRRDAAGAVQHAKRTVDHSPRHEWALAILRNTDLQSGLYDLALARYQKGYPEIFLEGAPRIDILNVGAAVDVALVYQKRGDGERASVLLDGAARLIRTIPRLGEIGYGIADVRTHALRGEKAQALASLKEAERAGWRFMWRYYRDADPALDSIRNEPEFKAVFADIERDMARQRARLDARPKDAPLELTPTPSLKQPDRSSRVPNDS